MRFPPIHVKSTNPWAQNLAEFGRSCAVKKVAVTDDEAQLDSEIARNLRLVRRYAERYGREISAGLGSGHFKSPDQWAMSGPPNPDGLLMSPGIDLSGIRQRPGIDRISAADWRQIQDFITSRVWAFDDPCLPEDKQDPLLARPIPYGAFMLGFDFHITPNGPRLIEINTNAAGLSMVVRLSPTQLDRTLIANSFIEALRTEYALAFGDKRLRTVAIIDDDVTQQRMYPEMLYYAELIRANGMDCFVISPADLHYDQDGLSYHGTRIDLVYNRITDFRLIEERHALLRKAALQNQIALTPHPASYVRYADKRNLLRLQHPLLPQAFLLGDRPLAEWVQTKKNWVFKPADAAGSRGVYRGDHISQAKLASLPPDTIAQENCLPPRATDGTKYDVRVYTRDQVILGMIARHYMGQVMEMGSEQSGFQIVLPDGATSFYSSLL